MAYIGQKPADKPLGASDITDGIISNSKLAQDIISAETELAESPASTDEFLISDAGVLKRLDASLVGGGKIGQVISTNKTDTFSESVNTEVFSNIVTGLTVSITPSAASSKILVFLSMGVGAAGEHGIRFQLFRDTTQIDLGDSGGGSRPRISKGPDQNTGGNAYITNLNSNFLDSPNSTSALTYGVKIGHTSGSAKTLYINRTYDDPDDASYGRGSSSITVMEILS